MGALTFTPDPNNPQWAGATSFNEDLITATTINNRTWQSLTANGGGTTTFNPEAGTFGIWRLSRGTTLATARAAMVTRAQNAANGFVSFGDGAAYFEWRVRIPILSTAAERFGCNVGLGSSNADTSATPGSSIHFRTIDDEAAGNWQLITAAGGAQNILDSGIPALANTWTLLAAQINAAGTKVNFFIDGNPVGNTDQEIPTYAGGQTVGPFFALFGGVGLSDRFLDGDWVKFIKQFSPARYP